MSKADKALKVFAESYAIQLDLAMLLNRSERQYRRKLSIEITMDEDEIPVVQGLVYSSELDPEELKGAIAVYNTAVNDKSFSELTVDMIDSTRKYTEVFGRRYA